MYLNGTLIFWLSFSVIYVGIWSVWQFRSVGAFKNDLYFNLNHPTFAQMDSIIYLFPFLLHT